ncbi:uncharacterized protein [Onthophagus taurus]|uniref:uncharacterized protein n=1 Tax=Onthophagus taurus TaxID=166361 RepID=UPI0039BE4C3E
MIQVLLNVIFWAKQLIYYILLLSYGTGKGIFYGLVYICEVCGQTLNVLKTLLIVMLEDFHLFLNDVTSSGKSIISGLITTVDLLINSIILSLESVATMLSGVYGCFGGIVTLTEKLFVNLGTICLKFKELLILFGSGVWFILEYIPYFLNNMLVLPVVLIDLIIQNIIKFTTYSIFKARSTIKAIILFIFDVPLEAFGGLLFIICIIYLVMKFHLFLTRLIVSYVRKMLTLCLKIFKVKLKRNINESHHSESSDHYCVICQDRKKCVLILPCKHLCLCNECSKTINFYNRRCPICRAYAERTMRVYT